MSGYGLNWSIDYGAPDVTTAPVIIASSSSAEGASDNFDPVIPTYSTGDLIVGIIAYTNSEPTSVITLEDDNGGLNFQQQFVAQTSNNAGTAYGGLEVWWAFAPNGQSGDDIFVITNGYESIVTTWLVISGADSTDSNPFDQDWTLTSYTPGVSVATPPANTTSTTPLVLVASMFAASTASVSAPTHAPAGTTYVAGATDTGTSSFGVTSEVADATPAGSLSAASYTWEYSKGDPAAIALTAVLALMPASGRTLKPASTTFQGSTEATLEPQETVQDAYEAGQVAGVRQLWCVTPPRRYGKSKRLGK